MYQRDVRSDRYCIDRSLVNGQRPTIHKPRRSMPRMQATQHHRRATVVTLVEIVLETSRRSRILALIAHQVSAHSVVVAIADLEALRTQVLIRHHNQLFQHQGQRMLQVPEHVQP